MSTFALLLVALLHEWMPVQWGAADGADRIWREIRYRGRTRYEVLDDSLGRRLRADSDGGHSALVRPVPDDRTLLSLRWRWRVLEHPVGADPTSREYDDRAAAVFVLVRRSILPWRTRGLLYQWAPAPRTDEWVSSPYARDIRVLTLQRDAASPRWRHEERDLRADLIAAFGEVPDAIEAVGVICDTDNTRGRASAEFAALEWRLAPRGAPDEQ